ncbi:MAG: hypothetical protein JZU50_08350 [Desulfobulbaceae bacterium]|nr:hypothetical protein [Desulfobulbaceae bacterium]
MRKDALKKGKWASPAEKDATPPAKNILVRKLTNLEDVRRVQARLVKEYLAGRISTEVAKTGAYLTATLTSTLRELKPTTPSEHLVEVVYVGGDPEEERLIKEMNENIMDAPDDNGDE